MPLLAEQKASYETKAAEELAEGARPEEAAGESGLLLDFPTSEPQLHEEELVRLWEGQRFPREALRLRDGQALQVVYRGRRNLSAGPDFLSALIADERGRLLKGDVELHVRSSAFVVHGHHLDPRYDNLVLHVVFHDDAGVPTLLRCGRRVAVVALAPWVARRAEELRLWLAQPSGWSEPCRSIVARSGWPEVRALLERLGQMRFRQKQARFAALLRRQGANQTLYEGLLRALGYSRNEEAFFRLAQALPYEELRRTLDREGQAVAEALLLGRAGLLPSQRHLKAAASPYVLRLEELWARRSSEPLAPGLWQSSGLRPNNLPARRLAGFARLLSRWPSLVAALSGLEDADRLPLADLIAVWQAPAEGFWRDHHDLSDGSAIPAGALIGRGRALEMLVNIVLPFTAAWGEARCLNVLSEQALAVFLRLPSAGSYGGTRFLEANFRSLAGSSRGSGGACLQQGRLYLYRQYCAAGECPVCPFSGLHAV
ncbi:MAG: DUF2851 family protein [Dehalococcoidia bacterium]|jgi:hypothetical protein